MKRLKAQYDFFLKAKKFKPNKKYDLIISSTPPLFVSWLGDIFSRKLKIPHVVDIRDLWPESIIETKMISPYNPLALYAKHISKKVITNATLLISPVRGILKRFPTKNSLWIPNSLVPLQNPRRNNNKKLRCIYAGTIGHMQNVEILNGLRSDYADFVVIGTGKNVDKLKDVDYLGSMNRIDAINEINKSDVGLVLMKYNKDFFRDALPSKIFEYIAYGKPIISNLLGETATFIKENKCGITIDGSRESLKAAVEFLANNRDFYERLSDNALKASAKYSKVSGVSKMLELLSNEE
jgi:glycosyltransferase involved in cell wall biosynthesis